MLANLDWRSPLVNKKHSVLNSEMNSESDDPMMPEMMGEYSSNQASTNMLQTQLYLNSIDDFSENDTPRRDACGPTSPTNFTGSLYWDSDQLFSNYFEPKPDLLNEKKVKSVPKFDSLHSSSKDKTVKKCKPKAYQLGKLKDPKLEQCRRNAVNAKKNRDKTKHRISEQRLELKKAKKDREALEEQMNTLSSQNDKIFDALSQIAGAYSNKPKIKNIIQTVIDEALQ